MAVIEGHIIVLQTQSGIAKSYLQYAQKCGANTVTAGFSRR